jgi:hypothetical protein
VRLSIFHSTSRALREFFLVLVQGYERAPRVSQLPSVLYLRGKGRKDTLGMDIIMPDGRVIKYELPAIYIERYTQDVIFQKKLLFFLPFYVMRYEKSREDIEKDPEKLQKLLDEYVTISRRLEESLLE